MPRKTPGLFDLHYSWTVPSAPRAQTTPFLVRSANLNGAAKSAVKHNALLAEASIDMEEEIEEVEDDDPTQIIAIMKALKTHQASKSVSGTVALQSKTSALIDNARTRADTLKSECGAVLDETQAEIARLRSSQLETDFAHVAKLFGNRTKTVNDLFHLYGPSLSALSQSRNVEVEAISELLTSFPQTRERSRKRLMKLAQKDLAEGIENQKLATDAQEYIKHFQALCRA
ncbi:hypothetical protein BOTBODRAFT_171548 [Botryobasidium botryosum FD-172 SS1]|uniref:Uncharacterized protein n=1 Tax=Botryobasidium botryosum (strain FD-172 SS1) TaxID=930990 RepID=A0A067MQL3_BOTB1|nr:hypothetical protein BOTBODRAFT_171548 [Botryobasidium botryosum FD-172 SS1]